MARSTHEISGFLALSARYGAYVRELETLAAETEEWLEAIRADDAKDMRHLIAAQLEHRLGRVYALAEVTGPKPSESAPKERRTRG